MKEIKSHILGFPRIGLKRELKKAQEKYWSGKIDLSKLLETGKYIRNFNWKKQIKYGFDFLSVGDFSWYDHVLTTSMMLGNIPQRHLSSNGIVNLDVLFNIARGSSCNGSVNIASEMKKWFNTNYHYIVPEFVKNQKFSFSWKQILEEVDEALLFNKSIKPILLSPVTYLWLGKIRGESFDKLDLLNDILPVYKKILSQLKLRNIEWIQFDEPILGCDLENEWKDAITHTYNFLSGFSKIIVTSYFGSIKHNLKFLTNLPIQGIHIDLVSEKYDLEKLIKKINVDWVISLGIINGRNIWRANLVNWFHKIQKILKIRKNIWISSSCSLLHVPLDVDSEDHLQDSIKDWFSFSFQKCYELKILSDALKNNILTEKIINWVKPIHTRQFSNLVHNLAVQKKIRQLPDINFYRKKSYLERSLSQKKFFKFPLLPTTTIGSFPQTHELRQLRKDFNNDLITQEKYDQEIKYNIRKNIKYQEELDLDVLVHGEPERNDMVEYFSSLLEGFIFTQNGWVQSYGSRCVKPPIIIGDVNRISSMTVFYTKYAQSLTKKPVKGMLTGPVTLLCWSFPREDLSREEICKQIALALQEEIKELESEGIHIIQIDEPALREGLPLRKSCWKEYLLWATKCFRLSASEVSETTQIHTHMCYAEFQDIMNSIQDLDADVITLEASRSFSTILKIFKENKYRNEVGPGVYDIHSPNVLAIENAEKFIITALKYVSIQRLWINPDCGLKTRTWGETLKSLKNMMIAVKNVRRFYLESA